MLCAIITTTVGDDWGSLGDISVFFSFDFFAILNERPAKGARGAGAFPTTSSLALSSLSLSSHFFSGSASMRVAFEAAAALIALHASRSASALA